MLRVEVFRLICLKISPSYASVSDQDPAFLTEYRSETGFGSNPDPGFCWPKLEKFSNWKKKYFFFLSKISIYLSLGLHKRRPSYKKSLQPSKDNIQHFLTWNFLTFFYFVDHFCPPGSGSWWNNGSQIFIIDRRYIFPGRLTLTF